MERIAVDLSGVPQTLLWNLGRRAEAARSGGSLLQDPRAVEVVDRLDYDFADTRCGAQWHAVRVATFDAAVRRFLTKHPAGTVVALGDGLETQFWRVDNGTMRWLTVDLPKTLAVRRRLLPDGPRQRIALGPDGRRPAHKDYVARQRAAGSSSKEIQRKLKRAIAREIFRYLTTPITVPTIEDLRPLRQLKNITLTTAANHLGVWPTTISELERDIRRNDDLATTYREWLTAT